MFLGIDVSTYFEEQAAGAKYFINGKEVDPLKVFADNGISYMRIRVWHHPYDNEGHPYLAGTNDIHQFKRLADLAVKYGMRIILDIHYSDFWADPGKQFCPKAWVGSSFEEIEQKVYEHTVELLTLVNENHYPVDYVQVGNEITNGMIWPYGQLDGSVSPRAGYDRLAKLLSSGIKAVREMSKAKVVIHLERSYDQFIYHEYFTSLLKYGVDFDVIGFSYYPYWHGTMNQLFANIEMCKREFHKEIMIMETGYGFTEEDYIKNGSHAQLLFNTSYIDYNGNPIEYKMSKEGQVQFIKDLLSRAEKAGVSGVNYWEPLWIPGENICWASTYAQKYIHDESKSTRNEWANQCLYDYEGNALPSLEEFKIK